MLILRVLRFVWTAVGIRILLGWAIIRFIIFIGTAHPGLMRMA